MQRQFNTIVPQKVINYTDVEENIREEVSYHIVLL